MHAPGGGRGGGEGGGGGLVRTAGDAGRAGQVRWVCAPGRRAGGLRAGLTWRRSGGCCVGGQTDKWPTGQLRRRRGRAYRARVLRNEARVDAQQPRQRLLGQLREGVAEVRQPRRALLVHVAVCALEWPTAPQASGGVLQRGKMPTAGAQKPDSSCIRGSK